jgi:hypothetical protein
MTTFSRRASLKALGAIFGSAIGTRLGARTWEREAMAAPGPSACVVSIFFEGGFNALFSSADSFMGKGSFGVTASNAKNVGNGLFVDASTIGTLGPWALAHMAAIGNRHGATDHISAQRNNFIADGRSLPLQLAAAMGGDAAFKAVALGGLPVPGPSTAEAGVSLQLLRTMSDVETALGVGATDFGLPARGVAAKAIGGSRAMSQRSLKNNPSSMSFARDAYDTTIGSLARPPISIDIPSVAQAYRTSSGANLDSVAAKLAAAELMIRSGTNVITMSDAGWDTHGDRSGNTVRQKMSAAVIPALKTFLSRIRSEPELAAMNISVILHGDFARSLPGSDHAPALSALVIGPNVKVGTTGKVSASVALPPVTGASKEMWSYLASIAKAPQNPFGANPHALVL